MIRKSIFILVNILISLQIFCQISHGGYPYSFQENKLSEEIILNTLNKIDIESLIAEDDLELKAKDIPLRFGIDIPTHFNLTNSGQWENLANGDRLWRLKIKSEGAFSLNFILKNFYLPRGARLFIFNEAHQFLGSFTSLNNNIEKVFASSPLSGDAVTFELYEPNNVKSLSSFEISFVIHAYRNLFGMVKNYGQSGNCNINVNCPQGADWQNQKRAVAMILTSNNTRICSGSMINNVRQDGTPYFLTANHCLSGATSNTWIFMFNYESPACIDVDGPTSQTVQGSVIRAKDSQSDFALLELNSIPPASYNVFYAGWNAIDSPSDSCVDIHHPSGDIKKITFDYDTVVSSGYTGPGSDHWHVLSWDAGTTEGGSSGSPLFDKHKRIIGQLHGGYASCSNPTEYDSFGKFAYSWNTGATPDKRLKDWLDPDGTGSLTLDGEDFNNALYTFDAAITKIILPTTSAICQLDVAPVIVIKNKGSVPINSLKINCLNNSTLVQTINWTGNLDFFETDTVYMPNIILNEGMQNLVIYITNPNNSTDLNNANDTLSVSFDALFGNSVHFEITTDNHPDETSWALLDSAGTVLYESANMTAQTTYTEIFCLPNGCYNFVISDTAGDGLVSPPGNYTFLLMGDTLGSGSGNFGFADTIPFCVNKAGIEKTVNDQNINIFPNPVSDIVNIEISTNSNDYNVEIFSIDGKLLVCQNLKAGHNRIDMASFDRGIYQFKVSNRENSQYYKIVFMGKEKGR